jgi:hypothetical protein
MIAREFVIPLLAGSIRHSITLYAALRIDACGMTTPEIELSFILVHYITANLKCFLPPNNIMFTFSPITKKPFSTLV